MLKTVILRAKMEHKVIGTFHLDYNQANREKQYWNTQSLYRASSYSIKYKKGVCVCKQQTWIKLPGIAASGHICSKSYVGAPKAHNHGVNHNYIVQKSMSEKKALLTLTISPLILGCLETCHFDLMLFSLFAACIYPYLNFHQILSIQRPTSNTTTFMKPFLPAALYLSHAARVIDFSYKPATPTKFLVLLL